LSPDAIPSSPALHCLEIRKADERRERTVTDDPERTEIILAVVRRQELLCVVRRSQLVGSAQGQWGVVTGFLETAVEPLEQALQELEEELSLRPPHVSLVRALPAVDLVSAASGKLFRVHPFLFESVTTEVTLNWEHDAVEWHAPTRLLDPDCVRWQAPLVRALLDLD
jgi:8-oxo-dGTP pyrophosphatase MutT (NUDIX family)